MGKKIFTILRAQNTSSGPMLQRLGLWENINGACGYTPGRRHLKTLILSTNVDQKPLETEFSIAICSPTGDK